MSKSVNFEKGNSLKHMGGSCCPQSFPVKFHRLNILLILLLRICLTFLLALRMKLYPTPQEVHLWWAFGSTALKLLWNIPVKMARVWAKINYPTKMHKLSKQNLPKNLLSYQKLDKNTLKRETLQKYTFFWDKQPKTFFYILLNKKTSRESRKAALRISHLLLRCQVVFTKICHYYYHY